MRAIWCLAGVLALVPACKAEFPLSLLDATVTDAAPPVDAAPGDAAASDAALVDAAPSDAAPVDAAPMDAAPVDAAPVDAAPVDSAGVCGNGTLEPGEDCDDNNLTAGDGCSDTCHIDCTNSSTTDCNYAGSTQVASSAFVDQSPPAGFVQCAGFENTGANDVNSHWDGNCLGAAHTLRIRYWDTSANPWTLLGDATLTPDSQASFTTQVFSATNNGGSGGFLETSGVTLLPDDPAGAAAPTTEWTCTAGPANKHYGATDLYFGNQADSRLILVSGYSKGDPGAALADDNEEIASFPLTFEECVGNPPNAARRRAVAIYVQQ